MDPTDVHFELGWNEIGMLLFVLALVYGIGGLKTFFGGRIKPHMTRQTVPGGGDDGGDDGGDADGDDDGDEYPGSADGDEEQSDDSESTGDPEDRA